MTKKTKNKFITTVVGGALAVSLMNPLMANAESNNTSTSTNSTKNGSFCLNVNNLNANLDKQFAEKESKNTKERNDREAKISARKSDQESKIAEKRGEADKTRADRFAKIGAKATSTAQIAAVDTFKATIANAVNVRRIAVDAAMTAYKNGVASSTSSRQTTVDTAKTNLRNAVDTAVSKAKTDCASGVSDSSARSTFKNSVKAAKDQFNSAVKGSTGVKSQVEALAKIRKAAVEKAHSDFKATVDAAISTLKISLGK